MHTFKTITLALMLMTSSIAILRSEEISPNDMDNVTLIQYALQLRETKPELFTGAKGVLVLKVVAGSQAEKKGLQRGDVIVSYNKEQINSAKQLSRTIQANATNKSQVELQFIRAKTVQVVALQSGQIGIRLADITKEILLKQFHHEFFTALQAKNAKKIWQLLMDNLDTAKAFQQRLATLGKGSGNKAEQYRAFAGIIEKALNYYPELDRLQEEGKKVFAQSNYPTALEKWQLGLKKAQELGDKGYISQFLGNIGLVYRNLGQYQKALDYYQQVLKIKKELGDKRGQGDVLGNLGVVYYILGDNPKALDYYQQALAIDTELNDKRGQGHNLGNISIVYHQLSNYPKALDYCQRALAIHKKLGDKHGQSADLSNIGSVYFDLGDYPKALDYYQQALVIDQELSDKQGQGNQLSNIGVVYRKLGHYSKALDYYRQSLKIRKAIGDRPGQGIVLANFGVVYDNLGDYPKALDYYQQALAINKELGDKSGIGDNLANIGIVYRKLGDFLKASDYYQQALVIHQKLGDKHRQSVVLTNIGFMYENIGEYQKAINAFQDSVAIQKTIGTGETWQALRGLASTKVKLNQSELAMKYYEQAIDNIEKMRNLLAKEHKISFMRRKLFVYDELIALLQSLHSVQPKKGYDRKAFEIFERKQGRLFLEEMGQSGARRFSGLKNEIIEAEQSLALKWQKLSAQSLSPQEYTALEQAEEQLKKRIKAEYPKYYALKYPQPVNLATLQNQVLQKGEMMLVYGMMKESIILWVIGKQHFQMFTLPINEETLKQEIAQLRRYLSQSSFQPKLPEASLQMYQSLLPKEVHQLIKDADILYIVPTGPLYGLPFGSLITSYTKSEIHYFIENHAISYLSSASLLKILRDEKRKTQAPKLFLAFADPEYPPCSVGDEKETETLAQLRTKSYLKWTRGKCLERLAATADEVREIASLFNTDHNKALYLGTKASRSTVFALNDKQELDDYRYVMFSVHGIIPDKISHLSKQLLEKVNLLSLEKRQQLNSNGLKKLEQLASVQPALALSNNSYLTMADAFALTLNADFVNLSACNSGCAGDSCSENVRGEGIMGLTRAFMYAGTSRVAVTLWEVNLVSAKDFSVGLFTHLKAKKKMAQALREVKLKMINGRAGHEEYRNPYHWAAFVVYGDGQ